MDGDEARVLAVLLQAADRHSVPVSHRQVQVLAAAVAGWLAERERPPVEVVRVVGPRRGRPQVVPSLEQLDSLVEKTRSRALSGDEVERLVAGIPKLRALRRAG